MASSIWAATGVTPAATDRLPVDVGAAGAPSRWTGQQVSDIRSYVGGTVNALGSVGTNQSVSLADGRYISATITGNVQFTFTSVPSGATDILLQLTNGGAHTVSFAATVNWSGGTTPSLQSSGTDLIRLYTTDDGTTFIGELASDEQTLAASSLTGQVALANGGTGANLTDPNADRILFWDDSAGAVTWLTAGTGLTITDTTITATATGSGTKTLARFTASDNQPPAGSFATLDTRNSVLVLDFDDASVESAVFVGQIPEGADLSSGISVRLYWMATSATTGNVRWRAEFEADGTDLDSDSFDTSTEATGAANGTSGIETLTTFTCTTIDSLAAGDRFRLRISRVGNDGTNDTMSGDAELVAVELRQVA